VLIDSPDASTTSGDDETVDSAKSAKTGLKKKKKAKKAKEDDEKKEEEPEPEVSFDEKLALSLAEMVRTHNPFFRLIPISCN